MKFQIKFQMKSHALWIVHQIKEFLIVKIIIYQNE